MRLSEAKKSAMGSCFSRMLTMSGVLPWLLRVSSSEPHRMSDCTIFTSCLWIAQKMGVSPSSSGRCRYYD